MSRAAISELWALWRFVTVVLIELSAALYASSISLNVSRSAELRFRIASIRVFSVSTSASTSFISVCRVAIFDSAVVTSPLIFVVRVSKSVISSVIAFN